MDEGQMYHIQLILDDARIVRVPGIVDRGVIERVVEVIEEDGRFQFGGRIFSPPDPDVAVRFVGGIGVRAQGGGDRAAASVGGDVHAFPAGIVLKAVEGALQVIVHHRAQAELDAAVRTFVHRAVHLSSAVAPEDHLLAHARHADGIVFHFIGFKQNIPLIAYHKNLILKSKYKLQAIRFQQEISLLRWR